MSVFDDMAKEMIRIIEQSDLNKQTTLNLIAKKESKSQREMWLSFYRSLINRGLMITIQEIPEPHKSELKSYAYSLYKDNGLTQEEAMDVCRCLVTIEYYLQKYGKQ